MSQNALPCAKTTFRKSGQTHRYTHTRTFWLFNVEETYHLFQSFKLNYILEDLVMRRHEADQDGDKDSRLWHSSALGPLPHQIQPGVANKLYRIEAQCLNFGQLSTSVAADQVSHSLVPALWWPMMTILALMMTPKLICTLLLLATSLMNFLQALQYLVIPTT